MKRSVLIPLALLTLAAVPIVASTCDRPPAGLFTASATEPATAPAVTMTGEPPLTPVPPAASRPLSTMTIDGKDVAFPAARLLLSRRRGGGLSAVLCSDDPPAAIEQAYAGNSFMFPMALNVSGPAELPQATWEFDPGTADDATGVFLHGSRDRLRPSDARITFRKDGDDVLAYLEGVFVRFDPHDPIAAPERIPVYAALRLTVDGH